MSKENIEKHEKFLREWQEDMEKYGEKHVYSEFMKQMTTIPNHPDPHKYEYKYA